jgi:hypothetical protein
VKAKGFGKGRNLIWFNKKCIDARLLNTPEEPVLGYTLEIIDLHPIFL